MTQPRGPIMPRALADELVIEALTDETLIYDLRRHHAHCLNLAATLVWRCCDGRTTIVEAARRLARELGLPVGEAVVWMGLDRLERARLLRDPLVFPGPRNRYSRRAVLRTLGAGAGLALLLPLVESIVAPQAAHAASCITTADCFGLAPPDCGGLPICGDPTRCCRQLFRWCFPRGC